MNEQNIFTLLFDICVDNITKVTDGEIIDGTTIGKYGIETWASIKDFSLYIEITKRDITLKLSTKLTTMEYTYHSKTGELSGSHEIGIEERVIEKCTYMILLIQVGAIPEIEDYPTRVMGKTANFALMYGSGAPSLASRLTSKKRIQQTQNVHGLVQQHFQNRSLKNMIGNRKRPLKNK